MRELDGREGRAGAWLWVFCFQFFVMEQVVRSAWKLPYSFRSDYISDLGAAYCGMQVCSPWHGWMDASFLLEGVLIAVGALRLRRVLGWTRLSRVSMGLLMASGLGLVVVGFVPEDMNLRVHSVGAAVHFLGGGLGCLLLGLALVRVGSRVAGSLSLVVGVAVLVATLLLGLRGTAVWDHLAGDVGVVERVAGYGLPAWFVGMGIRELRRLGSR